MVHANAPTVVMSRPTISACIVSVPSTVWMTSTSPIWRITRFASRTPLPPSMSRASAITARALRVLLNFASPAIVS